jgi:hypothetical protein
VKAYLEQIRIFAVLATVAVLTACTANPVSEANTFEQRAYALYGVYVIAQGQAAALTKEASVPDSVKQGLRDADKVSYPVAEGLVGAAIEVTTIREIIDKCPQQVEPDPKCVPTNEQRLANATLNLSTIYFKAQPVLLNLVEAVKGARK